MLYTVRSTLFSLLLLLPALAPAQSGDSDLRRTVASLAQDVKALNGMLGSLRIEVETLRRENAALKAAVNHAEADRGNQADILRQVDTRLAALKAELLKEDASTRKEIIASVTKQIDSLASQMKEALRKIAASSGNQGGSVGAPSFSEDYPKGGIMYLVEPGDTISGIASRNNSRSSWIRDANKIVDASRDLRAGDTIFVPQEE
ncbi:MAG: LysM peptidoglycan-binding domain-containing protein [Puniceicoccaceae bacterium]